MFSAGACLLSMQLREQYLKTEPMRDRKETYSAINKSIKTLNDPFTRLLEPSRYSALKRGNQGSVIGVGLEVGFGEGTDSQLVVWYCTLKTAQPFAVSSTEEITHTFLVPC